MTLIASKIKFSQLNTSLQCRLDAKYAIFTTVHQWRVFGESTDQQKISDLLIQLSVRKISKGELDDEHYLVNISDQEQNSGQLTNIETVSEIGSDKTFLGECDIFISKLGMPRGYSFLNEYKESKVLGSTEFIPYGIKYQKCSFFIAYLLLHHKMRKAYECLESGKTPSHRRVNPREFQKIRIPQIDEETMIFASELIQPIDKKIRELKAFMVKPSVIISEVFTRELGLDIEKYNQICAKKYFNVNCSKISSGLLRMTCRYNSNSARYLREFLDSKKVFFLKNILLKTIQRGVQPQYTDDGIKVIKTINIQNSKIDFSDVQYVDEAFLKKHYQKAAVFKNDLLLTSTGMGRGKFALYEDEEVCFADSHVSIIRFDKQKVFPQFLKYYSQSRFGVEQLKYIEMQIKGTPEIYEPQLKYFRIVDLDILEQKRIVDEIKVAIDKQDEIKKQIEFERSKIDEIIEKSMGIRHMHQTPMTELKENLAGHSENAGCNC